jgi:hypothetical protein
MSEKNLMRILPQLEPGVPANNSTMEGRRVIPRTHRSVGVVVLLNEFEQAIMGCSHLQQEGPPAGVLHDVQEAVAVGSLAHPGRLREVPDCLQEVRMYSFTPATYTTLL